MPANSRLNRALTIALTLLTGASLPAAETLRSAPSSRPITDQALQASGVLAGRVVDGTGRAQPNTQVNIDFGRERIASAATDEAGRFAFSGLHGGVHVVEAAGAYRVCRLWTPEAAPPAASTEPLVIETPASADAETTADPQSAVSVQPTNNPQSVNGGLPQSGQAAFAPNGYHGHGLSLTPYHATWVILGLGIWGLVAAADTGDDDAS